MKSVLRPLLLLVIAMGAGSFLAGWRGPSSGQEAATPVAPVLVLERLPQRAADNPRPTLVGLTAWELFRALPGFLAEASAVELEGLAAEWGYEVDANTYPDRVWKLLLARWLELDPQKAMRWARRLNEEALLDFCYTTWLHQDYKSALASALQEEEPPHERLLDAVAKHDPALGLQWAEQDRKLVYPFIRAFARHDLEGAIEAVDRFPAYWRAGLLSGIARSHAEVDPQKALALLEGIGEPLYHNLAVNSVLTELAKVDLGAAQAALDKMPAGGTRAEALEIIAKQRARQDPEAAWIWAKGLAPQDKREVLALCLERVARGDHEKVLALIDEAGWEYAVEDSRNRPADVVYQALLDLAEEDPKQALAHLAKVPMEVSSWGEVESPYYLATEMARLWFRKDPIEALKWMQEAPPGEDGEYIPQHALQGASEESLATVAAFLIEHPEGRHSATLSQRLLREMSSKDPVKALDLMEQLDAAGAMRKPDGSDVGESAYWEIGSALGDRDSLAASEWLSQLPAGGRRDAAVDGFVYELINHPDPSFEEAFHWASTIAKPESTRLKSTWRSWHEREPARAEAVLDLADLPEETKAYLRAPYQ